MRTRTRTESHPGRNGNVPSLPSRRGPVRPSAGRLLALSFPVVMALNGVSPPSAAGAQGPDGPAASESRAPGGSPADAASLRLPTSRGPKTERWCSPHATGEQYGDDRPTGGRGFGYRHRSAGTLRPAASPDGHSRDDCPDDEPRRAASRGDERPDDGRADARPADPRASGNTRSQDERPAAGSKPSGGPDESRPGPASGNSRRADSDNQSGRSRAFDTGGTRADDHGSPGSSRAGEHGPSGSSGAGGGTGDPPGVSLSAGHGGGSAPGGGRSTGGPGSEYGAGSGGGGTGPSVAVSRRGSGDSSGGPAGGPSGRPSGGRDGAFSGGNGGGSRRGAGAGPGGTGSGPGAGSGGPPGFRIAPGDPPSGRNGSGGADGVPGIAWTSFPARVSGPAVRSSGAALLASGPATAAASRSPTVHPAVRAPAGPLARTGGDISASAVLAFTLMLGGSGLRRTGRQTRARGLKPRRRTAPEVRRATGRPAPSSPKRLVAPGPGVSSLPVAGGKPVRGSSTTNSMLALPAQPADHDRGLRLPNEDRSFEEVLRHFRRFERDLDLPPDRALLERRRALGAQLADPLGFRTYAFPTESGSVVLLVAVAEPAASHRAALWLPSGSGRVRPSLGDVWLPTTS